MSTKLLRFPLSTFAPMYFDSKLLPIIHADLYCAFSQPFPNHGASMQIRHLDSSDESTRRRQQKRSPDRHRRRRPIAPLPRRGTRPCWPGRPRSPSGQLIRRSAAASGACCRRRACCHCDRSARPVRRRSHPHHRRTRRAPNPIARLMRRNRYRNIDRPSRGSNYGDARRARLARPFSFLSGRAGHRPTTESRWPDWPPSKRGNGNRAC